jgi:hypothetical protein
MTRLGARDRSRIDVDPIDVGGQQLAMPLQARMQKSGNVSHAWTSRDVADREEQR